MAKAVTTGRAEPTDMERIFLQQCRAFKSDGAPPVSERIRQLKALRREISSHRNALHDALRHDFRKPASEVDLVEIHTVQQEIDHALAHIRKWTKASSVGTPNLLLGTSSEVRYEPKGVVLILSPWNYPVTLTLTPLVSAIAAGNRAILKPSEFAPDTSQVLLEIIHECFTQQQVACFIGDGNTARELTSYPFDHIFFTGSSRVGREVMKAAAEHLTPVTLELGGKSPAIVGKDADVDDAAWKVVWGKFANAGQTCLAPDYVLVHRNVETEFVYALKREIRSFYGMTPEDRNRSPDFARMVRRKHFDHVNGLLSDAIERGATVAIGGDADETDRYIAPTVLTDVPDHAAVMKEEIFGPILPVIPFHEPAQAHGFIGNLPKPLGMYIYSQDDNFVEEMIEATTAGGTCVNDIPLHFYNPELPFGGVGESGFGRYHGKAGFRTFSNERAVVHRSVGSTALHKLTPPYNRTFQQLLTKLVRWI